MLELRVKITPENAEKIIRLIRELVESGIEGGIAASVEGTEARMTKDVLRRYLSPPPLLEGLPSGNVVLTSTAEYVGSWGQFNSFFPIKALLRTLAHMMKENNQKPVSLQALVDKSVEVFRAAGLRKYRGFPKKYRKDSAVSRFVWHFIATANEIGLIRVEGMEEIPSKRWEDTYISITRDSLEFARLENRLLDWNEQQQVLTRAESEWMINYLKKIDNRGYREYSFLREIFEELKRGNTDIAAWLQKNERFKEYIRSWSRKKGKPGEFRNQLRNLSVMFAQGKIALLRELGIISNRRNDYRIIGSLG